MRKVFSLAELANALDQHPDVLRNSDQLRGEAYKSEREEDGEYFNAHCSFLDGVLEVSCNRDWKVRALFVDPARSRAFDVSVAEIPMTLSRAEARARFGEPVSSTDGGTDAILGDFPPLDRFRLSSENCQLALSYSADCSSVAMLTLMPLDWEPGAE